MDSIEFWYDFASPYSYMAAERIARTDAAVRWRPLLLGPILQRRPGHASPFQEAPPAQKAYRRRDVERCCALYGIALKWPSTYPRGSLLAARVAMAAGDDWRAAFSLAVFRANFVHDRAIGEEVVVRDLLRELGQDADATLQAALSPANKAALAANVDEAISRGIFGAPSFMVGPEAQGELFWGNDRLDQALRWATQPWL